jgi:hypothetical protein
MELEQWLLENTETVKELYLYKGEELTFEQVKEIFEITETK